jgi:hypothetical protein
MMEITFKIDDEEPVFSAIDTIFIEKTKSILSDCRKFASGLSHVDDVSDNDELIWACEVILKNYEVRND